MSEHVVLVLNAGSSSLKCQVLGLPGGAQLLKHAGSLSAGGFAAAFDEIRQRLREAELADRITALGHRVVHGGAAHLGPTRVDEDLIRSVDELARLAPLHNPTAAEGMRHTLEAFPGLPQVAVFDTAFFSDLPQAASTYAIDAGLARREGIRRYGMHGISHRYVAGQVAELLGRAVTELDQIVLHLGNGASAAAIRQGRPIDTSMGLTPLEGLVMGTRAGDLDPGVLLHLQRHAGLDLGALEELLQQQSGLQGLAGVSDTRDLMRAVDRGDRHAQVAYEVYVLRIRKYVGAYLAELGGADAVTFTAGVGENTPQLREDALRDLGRLGIEVDPARNRAADAGARIVSTDDSPTTVLVVPTNEELAIARDVAELLEQV